MRVLVTGASGLLGRAVVRAFARAQHSVTAVTFSRAGGDGDGDGGGVVLWRRCDLRDAAAVLALVADADPDVIVHCAAERRPDVVGARTADARRMNVDATQHVARAAAKEGAWVLFVSTDYVFDGTAPPYAPSDEPRPLNEYGAQKLAAERALRAIKPKAGVLRVPLLYGDVQRLDESAVTTLAALLLAEPAPADARADDWAVRYPTYTGDVADVLVALAERKMKHCGFYGTWHYSAATPYTKFGMLRVMADALGRSAAHVAPVSEPPADDAPVKRPHNCQLDTAALRLMGAAPRDEQPFATRIAAVLERFLASGQADGQGTTAAATAPAAKTGGGKKKRRGGGSAAAVVD